MVKLIGDLRSGLRHLARNAGTSGLAILTLALGIGANTALFSIVQGVLLKPLPYPGPDRLMLVWETNAARGVTEAPVAALNFKSWLEASRSFESLAAIQENRFSLTGNSQAAIVTGAYVSAAFFRVMGVAPLVGRVFTADEDLPGGRAVAVLGYGFWRRRFGGDRGIVGRGIALDGKVYTVAGIMPRGFAMPQDSDLWVPIAIDFARATRDAHELTVIGRLQRSTSREQAQTEMVGIAGRLAAAFPGSNRGHSVRLVSLQDSVVANVRPALIVLLTAVAFVLLIACVNVANLLLTRAVDRERDIAVRSALGADRGDVVRQIMIECAVLFLLGGACGALLAAWGTQALVGIDPDALPRAQEIGFNVVVFGFALALSLATGLVVGLVPALSALNRQVHGALKEGGRGLGGGQRGRWLRDLLVGVEVAVALVLLTGAALLIQSFARLRAVDPGFSPRGILALNLLFTAKKYDDTDRLSLFYGEMLEDVATMPGVAGAATVFPRPLDPNDLELVFNVEGRAATASHEQVSAKVRVVSPAYFELLAIPFVAGRPFTAQDNLKARGVAIVNERLAKQMWPRGDALGGRVTFGPPAPDAHWLTVVGVVRDTRSTSLHEAPVLEAYRPVLQSPFGIATLLVKSRQSEPMLLARPVAARIARLDRDLPIDKVQPFAQAVAATMAQSRFNSALLGLFAALALLLAAIGIYGVLTYAVSRRTHEIGIQMALGANRGRILRMVLGQGMKTVLAGLAAGLVVAYFAVRLLAAQLFGVATRDVFTFTAVPLLLAGVALLAILVPARRATRVEPLEALRHE